MTKKNKHPPLVTLAKNNQKNKNFHHWYPWLKRLKKPKILTFGNLGHKWPRLFFWKRVKFVWGQCSCDIPTTIAFQGNFSNSEHCANVLTCFNLLFVCARDLATEKYISRINGSTEIIDIFTLARNPLGTAEAIHWHYSTIFAVTRKPLMLRPPERYCKKSFFTALILRYWQYLDRKSVV